RLMTTLYAPGGTPAPPAEVSVYVPSGPVRPLPPCPAVAPSGWKVTTAPGRGSPSSVTVPVTATRSDDPPQPAAPASSRPAPSQPTGRMAAPPRRTPTSSRQGGLTGLPSAM